MKFDYLRVWYFLYCLFHRNGYEHAKFLKKYQAFHSMGDNCFFQPYKLPADSKYIRFGNNVVVASNVDFICHDVIHHMLNHIPESTESYSAYWGIIDIKDNVFIGSNTTILPNVTIGSNVVIAAGTVVNQDIQDGVIVAGIPAKVIGQVEDLIEKRKRYNKLPIAKMSLDKRLIELWKDDQ